MAYSIKLSRMIYLFAYLLILQGTIGAGELLSQQPCDNFPYPVLGSYNIGIHNNQAQGVKPLHINGYPETCNDPAIRLEFQAQPAAYFGHLALKTPFNEYYSALANASDLILQSGASASNLILTTRNKGQAIKFAITPNIEGEQPDRERLRISSNSNQTLIDIKVPNMPPSFGNALLRFQLTSDFGAEMPGEGNNWKMGIDALGCGENCNLFKIGANIIPNDFSTNFDYYNTAITIKPSNNIILGNPDGNFINVEQAKVSIISDEDSSLTPLYVLNKVKNLGHFGIIDYLCTENGGIENDTIATWYKAFVVVNDLNENDWKEVFTIWGNGRTDIDGQVVISDGSNIFKKQQNHLDARLFVNGKIVAKEIYVNIDDWSDFVFDNSYILPELEAVEEHIKNKKHLPGIPSESEIKENGVNLADMQAKLLQKIEELTLYVIELKKENKKIKNELNLLKGAK